MGKKSFSIFATLLMVIQGAWAGSNATGYNYVERSWDSTNKTVTEQTKTCTSYTPINGTDTSDSGWLGLYDGWYVVTGNSSYKTLNVLGSDVHLIIPDGVSLTVTGGVKLLSGHKLTIYGQSDDSGVLMAHNSYDGGAGNNLYWPNTAMTIGAFRAYFQLADGFTAGEPVVSKSGNVSAFVLNFGNGEQTDIKELQIANSKSGNSIPQWYTIDGRRLQGQPTQPGLYISNGRKVVLK